MTTRRPPLLLHTLPFSFSSLSCSSCFVLLLTLLFLFLHVSFLSCFFLPCPLLKRFFHTFFLSSLASFCIFPSLIPFSFGILASPFLPLTFSSPLAFSNDSMLFCFLSTLILFSISYFATFLLPPSSFSCYTIHFCYISCSMANTLFL